MPFDAATRSHIASLDADKDAAALVAHGLALRPECLRTLRVCTLVLKKGAAAGLTPAQIAGILSRAVPHQKSPIEKVHAVAAALARGDEPSYFKHMGALVNELLEDFVLDDAGALLL